MSRRSERTNKGKTPAHLEEFDLDQSRRASDSDFEEDLDSTIIQQTSAMPDDKTHKADDLTDGDQIKMLISQLANQFKEMQATLKQSNDAFQTQLDATNKKLETVTDKFGPSQQSSASTVTSPASSFPTENTNLLESAATNATPITTATSTTQHNTSTTVQPFIPRTQGQQNTSTSTCNVHQHPSSQPYFSKKYLVALPKFGGNPCEWLMFIAEYRRTTYEYNYSSLDNMSRLNDCLIGNARELVKWLLIHDNMADKVIERLQTRFGRPELLVEIQKSTLREVPRIHESRLDQIVPFADKVTNFAHSMMDTECENELTNSSFLQELSQKLPMSTRLRWTSHEGDIRKERLVTILDFSVWLSKLADDIDRMSGGSRCYDSSLPDKKITSRKGNVMHTSKESEKPKRRCPLCEGDHTTSNCKQYVNLSKEEKWACVREKRLCFSCLNTGHNTRYCAVRKECGINLCKRRHHRSLHEEMNNQDMSPPSETAVNCHAAAKISQPKVLFKMLPVKLYGERGIIQTYAMIDEGSSISLINKELVDRLGLKGPKKILSLQWFGDQKTTQESQSVNIRISGVHKSAHTFELHDVCAVSNLCLPTQTLNMDELHTRYHGLRGLPIVSYDDAKPELLIGLDYCHLGISRRNTGKEFDGLIVTECSLGWIVYGKTRGEEDCTSNRLCHISESLEELGSIVKEYFTTENFGTKCSSVKMESKEDFRAKTILQSTTKRVGEKFESGLLWREDEITLPDSYSMAVKRFINVENKMKKDKTYAAKYIETMDNYLSKGYARKLSVSEAAEKLSRTWYLPHFGVLNPNKPGKFRLVFDAAASVQQTSLNSSLLSGPDMNQPLLAILFKFRQYRIGVCADIKEMYNQVLIRVEDQDAQRFLWRRTPEESIEVYKMLVMTFGSTSSPATAQYVKNCNALEFQHQYPEAAKAVVEKHYVDDYVDSFVNEDIAIQISSEVTKIHKAAGFELRGFISNSKHVSQTLNGVKAVSEEKVNMNMDVGTTCDKILGMTWDTATDQFKFQLKFNRIDPDVIICQRRPTKREFLAIIMSVYDPFGLLANFLVYMKILLQDVWRSGIGWDEPLPEHLHERWSSWRSELQNVNMFGIPRCYNPRVPDATAIEIHIFVDASEVAFAAVCYLRIIIPDEPEAALSFVIGKTRCAPNKYLSVPRLELQAAVLGVRLYNTVLESHNLNFTNATFWSDSKTVLHWISDDKRRYKSFVANRISEILDSTSPQQWKWVPSLHNVADDATRDLYPPSFEINSRWVEGPQWLRKRENEWPHQPESTTSKEIETELQPVKHVQLFLKEGGQLFDFSRYSSYFRILRTTGWVLRFVNNVKLKRTARRFGELTAEEISAAEKQLCRIIQKQSFPEEYFALSHGLEIDKKSILYKLTPYLDEDHVIRLSGRIDNAPTIPLMTKRPIILPNPNYLTSLIVQHYHCLGYHQNEDLLICNIRQKFWISSLRSLVRQIKRNCQRCKIEDAKPKEPLMGQLPSDRLTPYVRPFSYTGLDYFGPVYVTIGRRREKRWIALFTCLSIRAIHLEIAEDLSTDSCILVLRNFMNIRGLPLRIRSDNGSNFIGVKGELTTTSHLFDNDSIKAELSMKGIEWLFNCPSNPSAGGCWERLVRSVKCVLKQTLKEVAPRLETLRSYCLEAVNIVNSRPLTHIPISSKDAEPLTPNCFLMGTPNAIQSAGPIDEKLWCLRKQWRISNSLKNHFWRRWVREYLPTLTRRTKCFQRVDPLKVGDIVIICDEDISRSQWLRGVVEKVILAKDGQVRQAEVRTNGRILRRPASKLAVIDIGKSSQVEIIYGGRDVVEPLQ